MTHEERVYHHEMETCEGIHEHAERIAALEELVLDMWNWLAPTAVCGGAPMEGLYSRMAELGVEP